MVSGIVSISTNIHDIVKVFALHELLITATSSKKKSMNDFVFFPSHFTRLVCFPFHFRLHFYLSSAYYIPVSIYPHWLLQLSTVEMPSHSPWNLVILMHIAREIIMWSGDQLHSLGILPSIFHSSHFLLLAGCWRKQLSPEDVSNGKPCRNQYSWGICV